MSIPNNDLLAFTLANPSYDKTMMWSFRGGKAYLERSGVLRLEPEQAPKHSVVLSAGIHGNETAPIELVNALVQQILAGELELNVRLLVILGHPQAMIEGTRFCDVNLNRLFCGAWQRYEGMEVELAKQLEASVKRFFDAHLVGEKFHYDLHTAIRGSEYEKFAVHPFTNGKSYSLAQFAFHAACGIEAVLLSHQPATTFSYHSYATHGAHAATVELGQVKPFGENDLTRLSAIRDSLVALLNKAELAEKSVEEMKLFEVIDVLTKDSEDYQLNIPSDLKNFTGFEAGFVLAESSLGQYVIEQEGDAIVFPNTQLPVGQRAGLVVRVKDWSEFQ